MNKIEKVLMLSELQARLALAELLRNTETEWSSNLSLERIEDTDYEITEFFCIELSLEISSEVQLGAPNLLTQFCQVIGSVGDDEFAWICKIRDGVVEIDSYDLQDLSKFKGTVFPSVTHYLIFQLEGL